MATGSISQIKLPNGSTYDLKDASLHQQAGILSSDGVNVAGVSENYFRPTIKVFDANPVRSDLSVVRLSADDYYELVANNEALSNVIYVVDDVKINAYDQQIKNLAAGIDDTDAVNVEQLRSIADNIEDKIRYSLISATTSTNGTTQTVELTDRANSSATQGTGITTVSLAFPTATSGKARDFILALTCGSTPPNVAFPAGVTIVVDDQTDLAAEEGTNLYSFTEIQANTFVVSRLLVSAYSAQ